MVPSSPTVVCSNANASGDDASGSTSRRSIERFQKSCSVVNPRSLDGAARSATFAEIGVVDVGRVGPEGRVVDVAAAWWPKETAPIEATQLPAMASPTRSGIAMRGKKPVAAATMESPATTIATEEGGEPDVADLLLEDAHREEERRVALPVRRGEASERDPRGERERGAGDQGVGTRCGNPRRT